MPIGLLSVLRFQEGLGKQGSGQYNSKVIGYYYFCYYYYIVMITKSMTRGNVRLILSE